MRPRAILIAGPTASGKSALALALAGRLGGTIINADSMQVYRELATLTARPDAGDLARAPHRLYGHVAGAEAFSVGRWLAEAEREISTCVAAGGMPIVTGGTGLYFKALLEGIAPVPEIPEDIRAHWRARAAVIGPDALHGELQRRDPVMAGRLRPSDPQRITRALEVIAATGRSLADWQETPGRPLLPVNATLRLVVATERETLRARCDSRFDAMLEAGALGEVAALSALALDPARPIMRALGVRPLAQHVRGELSLAEATIRAKAETRQYAKRQLTWLRGHMGAWTWLDTQQPGSEIGRVFSIIDRSH